MYQNHVDFYTFCLRRSCPTSVPSNAKGAAAAAPPKAAAPANFPVKVVGVSLLRIFHKPRFTLRSKRCGKRLA